MIRYGSVCSGIEAATVAWHSLGWEPAFFSEIEAFPRAVLAHHYPDVPLHGDFTTIGADDYGAIDLLVGGTPCQSFSIAGLRGGLDDDRGNLALEFLRLAERKRPKWLVWENVPGVLSSNGGRDFGSILGGMVELGYGFAYRVLDAQYFGVAQRRRRVFVVGCLGDWRSAAAVLFERHSMSGHPAPSRKARKEAARSALSGAEERGGRGWERPYLTNTEACVTYSIMPMNSGKDYKARETEVAQPIMAGGPVGGNQGGDYIVQAFAHQQGGSIDMHMNEDCGLALQRSQTQAVSYQSAVRRLTPVECERLQGFPDNFTQIPWRKKPASECPDGPRYRALGNSMAVPVMRWIGERIQLVNELKI